MRPGGYPPLSIAAALMEAIASELLRLARRLRDRFRPDPWDKPLP